MRNALVNKTTGIVENILEIDAVTQADPKKAYVCPQGYYLLETESYSIGDSINNNGAQSQPETIAGG